MFLFLFFSLVLYLFAHGWWWSDLKTLAGLVGDTQVIQKTKAGVLDLAQGMC